MLWLNRYQLSDLKFQLPAGKHLLLGALLFFTNSSLRPAPFGSRAQLARPSQVVVPANTPEQPRPQESPVPRPNVEKGYFLFPIKPDKTNFLAGSMGELRPNHFHGGLDIKTDGRVDAPVYAAADGYISRMKQSSFGYGNVLYITHPNGLTTVYGHLNRFSGPVAEEMRRRQYEKQTYELELFFAKDQFLVRRGDIVALSGNTGGSGGPHLHWEVRDAQDAQLNPLQWGGFAEIQDHVAPTLQAFAVEPLSIEARVQNRFDKAVFVPKGALAPGSPIVWPDTITCFGTVGLQVQAFDRFDQVWNRNGVQHVTVRVNGQPLYQHVIDGIPFNDTRQISNHTDYDGRYTDGRLFEKLFVDDGNTLPIYTTSADKGRLRVEDGKLYAVEVQLLDSYGNATPLRFVLRGQEPAYTKTRATVAPKPAVRYDVTRNILKVTVADPDTARQGGNLMLLRGNRRLELTPSYTVQSQNVYLYDLRAGLPDSIRFGRITRRFDRQAMIPAGEEFSFSNNYLNLAFGPRTLFDTLYLQTSYKEGLWTVQSGRIPLNQQPLLLTLKPGQEVADKARSAVYMINGKGGKIYQGGKWTGNQISAPIKTFGTFRILTDTIPPSARLVSKSAAGLSFVVGDNLSGLASYRLLVNGQWRLLRYEYKNATLFTDRQDTRVPLTGEAELYLTDQAGNEKVLRFRI